MLRRKTLLLAVLCSVAADPCVLLAAPTGYRASVPVEAESGIDWVFTIANQSPAEPPEEWNAGYDARQQTFELFVPEDYDANKSYPLVLFISPGGGASGYRHWQEACRTQGILFAGPHGAGNNCPPQRRVRIVLDVLGQVRRDYNIDAERTYIAGFSGGGRVACMIAFALPEYFGGVIPICAGGALREESWLRQRVVDKLSIAHVTGENDFNRGEVERWRHPLLAEVGVRSRVWVVPGMGHGVPRGEQIVEVHRWLDEAAAARAKLAKTYPATRVAPGKVATREALAAALLVEAKLRLKNPQTRFSGLMQLKGILRRWPDLAQAQEAKKILLGVESGDDRSWEQEDIAEQRRFLIAEARALDAYASGKLPKQYEAMRGRMAQAALGLWARVLQDGQDAKAVAQAKQRIAELQKIVPSEKPQQDSN